MENYNEITENVTDYDAHRNIIQKWMRILLICQIANLCATALGAIAAISSIVGWISHIITIAIIVSLFNLSAVNERYRKTAIFYGISVSGSILSALLNKNMFAMVLAICSTVATYHELNAHSEITAPKNAKLSNRWHSLFYYQMVVGLMSGFITSAGVVIAVLADIDPDTIVSVALIVIALLGVIVNLFHVKYLKQTLALYCE